MQTAEAEEGFAERGHLRIVEAANGFSAGRKLGEPTAWTTPFFFLQLADAQLGMADSFSSAEPQGWAEEEALLRHAVAEINRLRPAFAVMCGDFTQEYPSTGGQSASGSASDQLVAPLESLARAQQTFDYKLACASVDPSIPLLCVCGNHDVGNRPTPESLALFRREYGDDYFAFHVRGADSSSRLDRRAEPLLS